MKVFAPTDLTLHDPPFEMVEGGRSVPYSDAPARVTRVLSALGRTGWAQRCEAPKAADRDLYIGGVHDGEYVDFLRTAFADYQREGAAYGLTLGPVLLPAIWPPRRPMARPQSLFARAGYHQIDLAAPIVAGTYAAACASVDCALAAADCVLAGEAAAFAVWAIVGASLLHKVVLSPIVSMASRDLAALGQPHFFDSIDDALHWLGLPDLLLPV